MAEVCQQRFHTRSYELRGPLVPERLWPCGRTSLPRAKGHRMLKFCSSRPNMKTPENKAVAEIPMLDLSRQYASIRDEVLGAVSRVCDSQSYILGAEVGSLEREFSALCGTTETVACASGTD